MSPFFHSKGGDIPIFRLASNESFQASGKSGCPLPAETMTKIAAVVAAGGTGTRMNLAVPKQFLDLAGRPILVHTLRNIQQINDIAQIIVVLPAGHIRQADQILLNEKWRIPVQLAAGGAVRQESVRKGVVRTSSDVDIILVHDAVRPLCDPGTMQRVVDAAREFGAAVPGLPATETIKRVSARGRVLATPAREELFVIQTPQCFRAPILRAALERARKAGYVGTDESSVVRWAGHAVTVVPGSPINIKITQPSDLAYAELLMGQPSGRLSEEGGAMLRVGQGIDYHRLVEGRKLILGGVEIPFEKGLEGHSDADALAHAVCDALLGAAALGDIGKHFPDTDPAHLNRPSLEFLREIRAMVEDAGWRVLNVDVTMLAQRPRLAPFMDCMKRNLAGALELPVESVSVKATTTEGMNAEGRGEGISAQAVVLMEKQEHLTGSQGSEAATKIKAHRKDAEDRKETQRQPLAGQQSEIR